MAGGEGPFPWVVANAAICGVCGDISVGATVVAAAAPPDPWGVRFERLNHLVPAGARVGDVAAALDFKSGFPPAL